MDEDDLPDKLELRVGEEQTLKLPSLASAGYLWEYELAEPGLVTIEKGFGEAGGGFEPARERLTLRGRKAGTTRLRLRQRRSWEREPAAERVVTVTVLARAKDDVLPS